MFKFQYLVILISDTNPFEVDTKKNFHAAQTAKWPGNFTVYYL